MVPTAYDSPVSWFLRLNPLVGLLTSVASRSLFLPVIILGTIILLVTSIFGRVFCGFICPLGAVIDFSDRYLWRRVRKIRTLVPRYFLHIKYVLLFMLFVVAIFGAIFPFFFDPISLMTRVFALSLYPLSGFISHEVRTFSSPVLDSIGLGHLRYISIATPIFYGAVGATILVVLIVVSGIFDRRFWCQYICPTGAFLGLMSRFALFRRIVFESRCGECRICANTCPTHAISDNGKITTINECIVCGSCTLREKKCNVFAFTRPSGSDTRGVDLGRRHAVAGITGGLLLVPILKANASEKHALSGRVIRPPGALPEEEFLGRCITCGACMKVCPSNAIQPCLIFEGFHRIYTPKIVPRIGGCEEKCYACGHVCPTGAIRKLDYEQKRFAKIGTAVINRHRCLAWEQNRECLVCDEVCPYNAIKPMIVETTTGPFKVPVIDEDLCLGCGMCEQHCPVTDKAAIMVYRFGENRISNGSYVTESQRTILLEKRRRSDRAIGRGLSNRPENPYPESGNAQDSTYDSQGALPPGFIQ